MKTPLISGRRNFYLVLSITFFVSFLSANSQIIKKRTGDKVRIDTVAHASLESLGAARMALGVAYHNSVTANDISKAKVPTPFFPYVDINFNNQFLPPAPFRVYLAKLSNGNNNDYVLVIGRCKEIIPPILKKTTKKIYSDIVDKSLPGSLTGADWIVISQTVINKTQDKVTYTATDWTSANNYVNNFKSTMKTHGLGNRYYTCFVVQTANGRGLFQPTIITPLLKNATILYQLSYFPRTLANGGGTTTCCATPPETGNSIDPSNN